MFYIHNAGSLHLLCSRSSYQTNWCLTTHSHKLNPVFFKSCSQQYTNRLCNIFKKTCSKKTNWILSVQSFTINNRIMFLISWYKAVFITLNTQPELKLKICRDVKKVWLKSCHKSISQQRPYTKTIWATALVYLEARVNVFVHYVLSTNRYSTPNHKCSQ